MAKANFRLVLHGQKDRLGRCIIFLRRTSRYKVQLRSTGRRIQPRFFNADKEEVRSSHPDCVEMNQYLHDFKLAAYEEFRKSGFDVNATIGPVAVDLTTYIDRLIKRRHLPSEFGIREVYATLLHKLLKHSKGDAIPFSKINRAYVEDFNSFLQLSCKNHINTRIKMLGLLKRIVTLATEDGIAAPTFPKLRMKIERTERRRLSMDEIKRLQAYDATPGTLRYDAKHLFLFAFFSGGLRFGDTATLEFKHIKDGALHFEISKTHKEYSISLLQESLAIINLYASREAGGHRYIFPVMPETIAKDDLMHFRHTLNKKNLLVNRELAIIATDLGIERFTFHSARNSIADYLRERGASIWDIQLLLKHSSALTTEKYLRQLNGDAASIALKKAFEKEE